MAFIQILRNASKANRATCGLLRTTPQLNPVKTYASLVRGIQQQTSQSLVKNAQPLMTRTISTTAPKMSAAGGNHVTLWTIERAISLALLGVIPAAFLFPSQPLDALMALSVILHTHWGMEAMVVDYVRPAVVGNVLPKVAHISLYLVSVASLAGLFYLVYNDIGIAKSVKQLWAVQGQ